MKQQLILPCIPRGATEINNVVGVFRNDNLWTYFLGGYPVHFHKADDHKMFRLVTSQLIESGACRQVDIIKAFGVSKSSVIRSQNILRDSGSEGFFKPRAVRTVGGKVFTPEVLAQAQSLLDEHYTRSEIAEKLDVKHDTLRKAINDGRLEDLKEDPELSRFTLVFDREGYSPAFFKQMWKKHRISCITYHKYPHEAWTEEWFFEHEVIMPRGETVT